MSYYAYTLVAEGDTPFKENAQVETFRNPVHVGDKVLGLVNEPDSSRNLQRVVAVEHYPSFSALYLAASDAAALRPENMFSSATVDFLPR